MTAKKTAKTADTATKAKNTAAQAEVIEQTTATPEKKAKSTTTRAAKAKGADAPMLVYEEAELPLRIVRDLFAGDTDCGESRGARSDPHRPVHFGIVHLANRRKGGGQGRRRTWQSSPARPQATRKGGLFSWCC